MNVKKRKNSVIKIYLTTFLTFCLCLFLGSGLQAQTDEDFEFKKGDVEINAGIGLMSTFVSRNTKTKIPPLSTIISYRIQKHLSVGAYFGFSSTEYDAPENSKDALADDLYLRNDFYLAGLRLQGHYNSGRMDFYGGAMFGYNFSKIDTNIEDPHQRPENIEIEEKSLVTYSGFIGLKHMITPGFGVYGEIGYGASLINLGASYRF